MDEITCKNCGSKKFYLKGSNQSLSIDCAACGFHLGYVGGKATLENFLNRLFKYENSLS